MLSSSARILAEFAKKADKLEIKGGVVEDTYYDAKGMQVIATIPSREVLLENFLKHAVSDHKLRSCYQTDRRAAGGIKTLPAKQGCKVRESRIVKQEAA